MKKFFLLGSMAFVMSLSSCTGDGYTERQQTIAGTAITIISSLNDDDVVVSEGSYIYSLKITDTSVSGNVTSPDLVANNTVMNFTTDDQAYKSTGYDAYFENAQGNVGNTSFQLNHANFQALYLYDEVANKFGYYYNAANVGKYTYTPGMYPWITLASYNIGNTYKVNTFQKNTFFKGETATSYTDRNGESHLYNTDAIMYRFMLNKEENSSNYTADLLIYDAKFSDNPNEKPKDAILAQGLKVEFTSNGITISGEDIIPSMLEGGDFTEVPAFKFNYVKFNTTDLYYTQGVMDYQVAGMYNGHFEGAYLVSYYMK